MNKLLQRAFLNALGTVAYICLIVLIIGNAEKVLGDRETILIPMTMLMLFVLSAAITGGLVLGKPILMYVSGEKTDAVKLFMYTVGWLAVYTVIFFFLNTIV